MKQGNTCQAHPELAGRRHNDGNCPACVKVRQRQPATYAAQLESNRRWRSQNREKTRALDAAWRAANPDRVRDNNLRRIGWSLALLNLAMALQEYRCAICRTDLRQLPRKQLHADHDHSSGAPRGVLCHHCNAGLGAFRDNPEALCRAVAYLTAPPLGALDLV